jgi:hypothetical protein
MLNKTFTRFRRLVKPLGLTTKNTRAVGWKLVETKTPVARSAKAKRKKSVRKK